MCKFIFIVTFLLMGQTAQAACLPGYIKDENRVGQGAMRVMFLHIYDAALYAPQGKYAANSPFSLRLIYKRDIKGKRIAGVSVDEIRKQGMTGSALLAQWQRSMENIFPDVAAGDSMTGVFSGGKTVFCQGNTKIGVIEGTDFARQFFGIWLLDGTSAPELRRKLLGNP